ncbi:SDR family oxidoreductase [Leptobacterium sp. I13]|uniref:SDR family oxidoreductase n=1 Tax=Leptobacterium meishanense TaxID=3128904 RepID=UPI0030EBDC41
MRILLTGATGYIGKRLLPALVDMGHEVVCCVRDRKRFNPPESIRNNVTVVEVDFLKEESLEQIPHTIDAAYYLMHSMSSSSDYEKLEEISAKNFKKIIDQTQAHHVVYLSGIVNNESLSKHLNSRKAVEEILSEGNYKLTTLRSGIIIGSGSASFEIIRDLVEKLPIMIAPKWLQTKCQPIAVRDVISFLTKSLFNPITYNNNFDIGGPDILSYKQMLLGYAKVRGLKRRIISVPIMTPKLSSYWLYFVTSTSYKLATSLVNSMKVEVICRDSQLSEALGIAPLPYEEALKKTLLKIEENEIVSSWKDSWISGRMDQNISEFINVPRHGCLIDIRENDIKDIKRTLNNIWRIGGNTGWYYATSLWKIRGYIDKLVGGVGLRRGRTHPYEINVGDAIDFWRVLYANKREGRLLLFAEMKLPGEAWLEFKIKNDILYQTATFRPKGLWGRLYWYILWPVHDRIFEGMIKRITV